MRIMYYYFDTKILFSKKGISYICSLLYKPRSDLNSNFLKTICKKSINGILSGRKANGGERGRLILIVDCLGPTQERIYSPSQSLLQDITFCSTLESWYQTVFSIFTFCILPSCFEIGEISAFKSSQEPNTTELFIMLNSIYVSNIPT